MKFDKTEVSGIIVLFVGVILLAFTFYSAYSFLSGSPLISGSADLTQLFGNAMAPLIEAIIRILYLGIMGWIGSILTIRAVQLLKREKETMPQPVQSQVKPETKPSAPQAATPAKVEPKPDVKKSSENPEKAPAQAQPKPEQPKEPETQSQTK